jgi:hypothetical protein
VRPVEIWLRRLDERYGFDYAADYSIHAVDDDLLCGRGDGHQAGGTLAVGSDSCLFRSPLSCLCARTQAAGRRDRPLQPIAERWPSVGRSVVSYLLTRNNQVNHATIASLVTAFNHAFDNSTVCAASGTPGTAGGRAALDQVIQTQASIISYIDDFKLMMILSLAAIPLILLLRRAPTSAENGCAMVME